MEINLKEKSFKAVAVEVALEQIYNGVKYYVPEHKLKEIFDKAARSLDESAREHRLGYD